MLGDTLRREREKQGLTIKDIENETSIRSVYIEAIEKGNYDSLPGDVYTKGFIKNYARALNIDSSSLLQEYNSERNISSPVQPVDQVEHSNYYDDDVPQRTVTVKSSSNSYRSDSGSNLFSSGEDYRERTEEKGGSRKFLLLLVVLAVFLGGVWYAFSDNPTKPTTKPTVKTEQTKKDSNKNQENAAAKKYDEVDVTAKFDDVCWLSVSVDGKSVFEGMAEKGKEMNWKGKEKVSITAGNAGAMSLTWNGNNLGKIGGNGQVVERTMTKDSDGAAAAKSSTESNTTKSDNSSVKNNSDNTDKTTNNTKKTNNTKDSNKSKKPN